MKINGIIYKKLLAQAQEAKEKNLTKLAENIYEAIGSYPEDEITEYSYAQLQEDIQSDIWKIATRLVKYYNVKTLNAEKLDQELVFLADDLLNSLESSLKVDQNQIGIFEPKVPGEK